MASEYQYFVFKPEIYQEPKKLAGLQLGVWNFCGDFNARKWENEKQNYEKVHYFKRGISFLKERLFEIFSKQNGKGGQGGT